MPSVASQDCQECELQHHHDPAAQPSCRGRGHVSVVWRRMRAVWMNSKLTAPGLWWALLGVVARGDLGGGRLQRPQTAAAVILQDVLNALPPDPEID